MGDRRRAAPRCRMRRLSGGGTITRSTATMRARRSPMADSTRPRPLHEAVAEAVRAALIEGGGKALPSEACAEVARAFGLSTNHVAGLWAGFTLERLEREEAR